MDEAVRIEVSGKIDGKIARSLRDIAKAAIEADTNLDLLRNAINGFNAGSAIKAATNDTRSLRNEIVKTTQSQQALAKSSDGVAGSLNKAAAAGTKYGAAIKSANTNTTVLVRQGGALQGVMGGLVGTFASFFAVQQWAQSSDAMTSYTNRLKVVGLEGEALASTMDRISQTALRNGQSMDGLSQLYLKVASAQQDINATSEEMLGFLDAVAAGLRIQGGAAGTANGALLQLSQAIGASRVEAQEFNSIVEGMYPIAMAAAKGIDGFGGSVSRLQRFIREGGTITGEQLFRGILSGLGDLQAQVSKTQLTISQSLQNLRTQFELWTQGTAGSAALVSNAIAMIGQNLNIIIPLIAAFAAAWAIVKLATIAMEIIALARSVMILVTAFIAMNAITIVWLGIIGLIATGILALAYAVAVLTGNTETFEKFIADSINKARDFALGLVGMKDATGLASEGQALLGAETEKAAEAIAKAEKTMEGLTGATNDNKAVVNDWANTTTKAVEKVTNAYYQLTNAQQAALAAGATAHYQQLQAAGGSSGSFASVAPPTSAKSITTAEKPKGFYTGGSMMVGGRAGVDQNLISFRASQGERIDVKTAAQQRAEKRAANNNGEVTRNTVVNFNITTPDADSFRRSSGQINSETRGALG